MVLSNNLQVKQDIQDIINSEYERLLDDPALAEVIVKNYFSPHLQKAIYITCGLSPIFLYLIIKTYHTILV